MSKINRYYPDNVLFIPLFQNKDCLYNMNNIYTPRKFKNTDEYIIHLENLRKLKNYVIINKHLELLDGHVYKNIIKKKLVNINWHKKIKEKTEEEKHKLIEKINIMKKSEINLNKPNNLNNLNNLNKPNNINNLNKANNINNKNNVYNDTLNYKNLKKVNIKKNDIDILRKELKLPKI